MFKLSKISVLLGVAFAASYGFAASVPSSSGFSQVGGSDVTYAPTATGSWYIGAGVNTNAAMKDKSSGTDELSNHGVGGNFYGGYQFNRYLGAQLGFNYIGSSTYKNIDPDTGAKSKIKDNYNFNLTGNLFAPISSWFKPYVFAGVAYMNEEVSCTAAGCSGGFVNTGNSRHYRGFGFIYGTGLEFNIKNFGIRASYTAQVPATSRSLAIDSNTDNAATPSYISLEFLYRFQHEQQEQENKFFALKDNVLKPWYVGIGGNYAVVYDDNIADGVSVKSKNLGLNLFLGYRANRFFGTQFNFSKLGNFSYSDATNKTYSNQYNFNIVANAFLPITSWFEPYAFVGPSFMSVKYTGSKSQTFGMVLGGGVQFNIVPINTSLRFNYTQQISANNRILGSEDSTWSNRTTGYLNFDVLYRFGH